MADGGGIRSPVVTVCAASLPQAPAPPILGADSLEIAVAGAAAAEAGVTLEVR